MSKRRKGTHFALDPLPERVKSTGMTHYIIHSSLIAHVSLLKKRLWYVSHLWGNSTTTRYNNLEQPTYRNGIVSGKTDFHVDISKYPGGEFFFSTWGRKNSSKESNETSEKMNDAHVENKKYPRGDLRFSTWIFEKGGNRTNFPVKICY